MRWVSWKQRKHDISKPKPTVIPYG
jgi:hypothetical protein